MHLLFEAFLNVAAGVLTRVVRLFRTMWPEGALHHHVDPWHAAAAAGVVAIAAPFGYLAVVSARLGLDFLNDDLLFFLGLLLITPLMLFCATLAAGGLAAGLAVALGLVAGNPTAVVRAWAFVGVGAFEVVLYLHLAWPVLAALTLIATLAEVVLLLHLPSSDGLLRSPLRRLRL